jgi:hypothetical protein
MDVVNFVPTPMESGIKFNKNNYHESPIDKAHMFSYPYSQAMGSLMHAIINCQPVVLSLLAILPNTCLILAFYIGKALNECCGILKA